MDNYRSFSMHFSLWLICYRFGSDHVDHFFFIVNLSERLGNLYKIKIKKKKGKILWEWMLMEGGGWESNTNEVFFFSFQTLGVYTMGQKGNNETKTLRRSCCMCAAGLLCISKIFFTKHFLSNFFFWLFGIFKFFFCLLNNTFIIFFFTIDSRIDGRC